MSAWLAIALGLAAGASSAPHCFAMCGALATFASGNDASARSARLARHQLGRLVAYAFLGAVAAGSGAWIASMLAPRWASIVLGALLGAGMLAMAVELGLPARGAARPIMIGRAPRTPLVTRVLGRLPRDPVLVGAVSALLPCGALYGGLLTASGTGGAALGALCMSAFAIASGVGLIAAASFASYARSATARSVVALALVVGAMLVIARPIVTALQPDARAACMCGETR